MLIITDIGGYTRYMTANAKTLAHGQTIITELIQTIAHEIALPLEIAKLEGDAVFLYCRRSVDAMKWLEMSAEISRKLVGFFELFQTKLHELTQSTHCTCNACAHIDRLQLKIVVHSGEALFHRVLHFNELAGVDVIIVHRLLKNSIRAGQYLLLTEAAMRELPFPAELHFKLNTESYPEIGILKTAYHNFDVAAPAGTAQKPEAVRPGYREIVRTSLKLWFAPLTIPGRNFRNVSSDSSAIAKVALAAFTLLLTPFMVPSLLLLGLFRR